MIFENKNQTAAYINAVKEANKNDVLTWVEDLIIVNETKQKTYWRFDD